jgi:hypothetical protein
MMGHMNLNCGYQTTSKQYKYSKNKGNNNAKLVATPHRCSTVLAKHVTQ